jgi:hypothetical protein
MFLIDFLLSPFPLPSAYVTASEPQVEQRPCLSRSPRCKQSRQKKSFIGHPAALAHADILCYQRPHVFIELAAIFARPREPKVEVRAHYETAAHFAGIGNLKSNARSLRRMKQLNRRLTSLLPATFAAAITGRFKWRLI